MPGNLRKRLSGLHSEPDAWFLGHFAKYHLSHLQPSFLDKLKMLEADMQFKSPIVGVYLNTRTSSNGSMYSSDADFINEIKSNVGFKPSAVGVLVQTGTSRSGAIYVPEKEYIEEADMYFTRYHRNVKQKRIFLATDDADLRAYYDKLFGGKLRFIELPKDIKQFGHEESSQGLTPRFIHSLITEVLLLVKSDYVICTFSSHVCRLVYELKQASSLKDASSSILSLDYSWGFEQPGYSWSPDLSILTMALHNGHFVDKSHVSYSQGEMFDLFSWSSHNKTKGINVIGVRQRNVQKPQVGHVAAKDFSILVNINDEPPYVENSVFA